MFQVTQFSILLAFFETSSLLFGVTVQLFLIKVGVGDCVPHRIQSRDSPEAERDEYPVLEGGGRQSWAFQIFFMTLSGFQDNPRA